MSVVDADFHRWRNLCLQNQLPVSVRREALVKCERLGLVNFCFDSSWWIGVSASAALHCSEQLRRWNCLEYLYRDGNVWQTVPESVRDSDLLCGEPELFATAIWSELVFDELVALGLPIGNFFELPADWETAERAPRFSVGGVSRAVVRDADVPAFEFFRFGRDAARAARFLAHRVPITGGE